jgi:transposase
MGEVSTIGLDIAKSVFQVHGVDVAGAVVIRKRVVRAKVLEYFGELPPCLVGLPGILIRKRRSVAIIAAIAAHFPAHRRG